MTRAPAIIPLADTLRLLLPGPQATAMLQAALLSGDRAREAWTHFIDIVPDSKAFLQGDDAGVKRHLPLLHANLFDQGVEFDGMLGTILRTATMREELRTERYRRHLKKGLAALHDAHVPFVLLKGAALSETIYPCATLRHSHDIDLLVSARDRSRAESVLAPAGFGRRGVPRPDGMVCVAHRSGLPIELHVCLFRSLCHAGPEDEMLTRVQTTQVLDMPVRLLDASDMLAHVIAHVLCNPRYASFSWVVDAVMLTQRHPDIDWARVTDILMRSNLSLPGLVMLDDLVQRFGVSIPQDVRERLAQRASTADRFERMAVLQALRIDPPRRLKELLKVSSVRSRVVMLSTIMAPPRNYLRQMEGAETWPRLLGCYSRRPIGFGLTQMRKAMWRFRRTIGATLTAKRLEQTS